ncbi:MgtC/SapB family protein [Neorhodopirellula lusitana]
MNPLDLQNITTVGIAACLGAILGIEREIRGKPAGLRTHIFVCAGSALMMILGHEIIEQFRMNEPSDVLRSDPIRVLQSIVVGISFLGAGTIVHDHHEGVEGLTTAATIYLTAGIGVATSVNRVGLAVAVTVSAFCILIIIGFIERRVHRWHNKAIDK